MFFLAGLGLMFFAAAIFVLALAIVAFKLALWWAESAFWTLFAIAWASEGFFNAGLGMKMFADGISSIAKAGTGAIDVLTKLVKTMKDMPEDIRTSLTMASNVEPVKGGKASNIGKNLSKITEKGKELLSGQKTDSMKQGQAKSTGGTVINNVTNNNNSSGSGNGQMIEPWETDMTMRFGKLKDGFESFMGRNL